MDDIYTKNPVEYEAPVELLPIFISVLRRWWLICMAGIVFAAGAYLTTKLFVTPLYASDFTIYVSNRVQDSEQQSAVSTVDLTASRNLASTYAEIISGRNVLEQAAAQADLLFSYEDLCDMVAVSTISDTEIISIRVTTTDPVTSVMLARSIADVAMAQVSGIVEGSSMRIIDGPDMASEPCSPKILLNVIIGAFFGVWAAVSAIVILYIMDINVNADTLERRFGYPVFEYIPASGFDSPAEPESESLQAIQEAYRALRTNVAFTLGNTDANCIAVTCGDCLADKSNVSINLAVTFAQTDKNVLLIDCDMQQRTLTKMLDMSTQQGLSDVLTGNASVADVVCRGVANVDIIPAGRLSAAPKMLLESKGIDYLIQKAREKYDYIFVDLTSVNTAADAAVMARCVDGFLLVLCHKRTKNKAVGEMLRRLDLSGGKVLGFVIHGVSGKK